MDAVSGSTIASASGSTMASASGSTVSGEHVSGGH
jgi:hypothetical protein